MTRPALHAALCLLLTSGCSQDPACQQAAPGFRVTVSLGKLSGAAVDALDVDLTAAGKRVRQRLRNTGELADGETDVGFTVGAAGAGGFQVKAVVRALDSAGKVLAKGEQDFTAGGHGCNAFALTLMAHAADAGPDAPRPDGPGPDLPVRDLPGDLPGDLPADTSVDVAPPKPDLLQPDTLKPDMAWPTGKCVSQGKDCSKDGWCWEHPLPSGKDLRDITGAGPKEIYFSGAHGALLRWDGARLRQVSVPAAKTLWTTWGSASSDLWVGEDNAAWRWRGGKWTHHALPCAGSSCGGVKHLWGLGPSDVFAAGYEVIPSRFNGATWGPLGAKARIEQVWAFSPTDVWLVGYYGKALRWDGKALHDVPTNHKDALHDLWGSSPTDVWAVGSGGAALRWDGAKWKATATNTVDNLWDVWGSGASDVLAVGASGVMLRWDGAKWSPITTNIPDGLLDVWGTGATNAWIVGQPGKAHRWDGSTLTAHALPVDVRLSMLYGTSATDVLAMGEHGVVVRYDGKQWTSLSPGPRVTMEAVWAAGPDCAVAGGSGGVLLHYTKGLWTRVNTQTKDLPFKWIWGSGPSDIYAVGAKSGKGFALWHYNGAAWLPQKYPCSTTPTLLWGTGPSDVHFVVHSKDCHYDGGKWTTHPLAVSGTPRAFWVHKPGDAIMVGDKGAVQRWNGQGWAPMNSNVPHDLYSVWGSGPSDVFAGGKGGTMVRFDGQKWTPVSMAVSEDISALWGTGATDVWAGGAKGAMYHYTGAGWTAKPTGTSYTYRMIAGSGPTDVYAAGANVVHFDGNKWSVMDTGSQPSMQGLWVDKTSGAYLVRQGGTILHRCP